MHHFRTHTEINLVAIRRNAEAIKAYTGKQLIAVIKADAYGHGMIRKKEALAVVADILPLTSPKEGFRLC
ncbi:MAG: alanine racemase [Candidatus Poribacteria bacterium]|nr:alanine racemase [Candidatus Poribacteria bacterium]